jgi:hypothetical protein
VRQTLPIAKRRAPVPAVAPHADPNAWHAGEEPHDDEDEEDEQGDAVSVASAAPPAPAAPAVADEAPRPIKFRELVFGAGGVHAMDKQAHRMSEFAPSTGPRACRRGLFRRTTLENDAPG